MPTRSEPPPSFSPARRWGIGLNVAVSVLAVFALLVMVNYLGMRHYRRFQWSADERTELATQTRQVLRALTNDVRVTVLFDRNSALYAPVTSLLKEYGYASPRLLIEHVDYNRDLARARLLVEKHQLPQAETDVVIFEAGSRTRIIRSAELSEYDLSGLVTGEREVKRVRFKGEPLFTSALASLLEARPPVAYFLQGHGEHDPASTESRFGYTRFARLLQQKNIAVLPLRLGGDAEIPADCQLLVIAGPRSRLAPTELEKLNRYLNQGGRLFALLSFYQSERVGTGLEALLADWGVAVGENFAFDLNNAVPGGGILVTNLANHTIMKPLRGQAVYVVLARSVEPLPAGARGADAPRVEPIFATSVAGFTASNLADAGLPKPEPGRDRRGVIPLAVAVEKGSIPGVTPDRGSTRIVAVGESIFLANETIVKTAANIEFASSAVNWLLDRPVHLSGIAARPLREYSIVVPAAQMSRLRWLLLGVLPGAPLVLGWLVWWRRRR